ncbi:MAG: FGGY-family carbohydrate kinase [Sedimentisphaeraceae bacterium JB056]
MSYLLGFDSGTSSIKATLLDAQSGKVVVSATSPSKEMEIISVQSGWAEQSPEMWWENLCNASKELISKSGLDPSEIEAIGITYQMHGLVAVDKKLQPLRASIIWCDSRAVEIGNTANKELGEDFCLANYLNSPGNFTASKLKWVKDNEPEIYDKIYKVMLPGDYLAMKMTGDIITTVSGLSEGIMWNFKEKRVASELLDYYGISPELLGEPRNTFSLHGRVTKQAAKAMGLKEGIKVAYRAGDQPNNAFSLKVLEPGEVAATAGTSGVIYGIGNKAAYDHQSRVNTFAHVNYTTEDPRYGGLLCLNGTGILNSWLKHNIASGIDYPEMNEIARSAPVGSAELSILPYGNGAERTLSNQNLGASLIGINFNVHDKSHILRAAQEGIVFALNYGLDIMREMGIKSNKIRAGKANMFLSPLFAEAFATVTGAEVELYDTDGSQGAARGAGLACGLYKAPEEAYVGFEKLDSIEPNESIKGAYQQAYGLWLSRLESQLN